ncbi:hypothetical protein [Mycoplasma sp. P36-A1]|uniref:hypothetical protein n=1 Tax=Mycoplasma sp. P36-A1 TaxID=3252900 RepID=UPI003C2D7BF3
MKINAIYIGIGVVLSILSKFLQFEYNTFAGDMLVLVAAYFFVRGILFSTPWYNKYVSYSKKQALVFGFSCYGIILSFQLMLIMILAYNNLYGLMMVIPLIVCIFATYKNIIKISRDKYFKQKLWKRNTFRWYFSFF